MAGLDGGQGPPRSLKSGTLAEYRRYLSCQVLDQFGSKAVASITPRHCEQFLSGLMQRGLAPKTTEHVWSALNRVMKYAMTHGGISSNPAERVDFAVAMRSATTRSSSTTRRPLSRSGGSRRSWGSGTQSMACLLAYSALRSAECQGWRSETSLS